MEAWITFWMYACIIGFASYYIIALVIIPLGARDLLDLFRHLSRGSDRDD